MTTGLLVSVRDRCEALDALSAGADLIDLKEPRRGSLGAVDAATMREVAEAIAGRAPLSAALGELLESADDASANLPAGFAFAKFGLAGCADRGDWALLLARRIADLPPGAAGVAVVYADWRRAAAPSPAAVLAHAASAGCRAVLVDTWRKGVGGLMDLWSLDECSTFIASIHAAGLTAVLGGSLTADAIGRLLPLAPDFVAVRGAVCAERREGRLDPARVRALAALVGREPADAAAP